MRRAAAKGARVIFTNINVQDSSNRMASLFMCVLRSKSRWGNDPTQLIPAKLDCDSKL
jgi:hypothetical protein